MPRVQETTGGPSSLGSVLGGQVSVTGVRTSGTRPLGPHPGFAGNLGPSCFHTLPMGGAVLPPALPSPPLPGAPPSREPPRQARLWSGNFLSFQVLAMFFSSFWGRGTEGRPAGPAPPFIPFFSEGLGTLPGGATQRQTVREELGGGIQGDGKWR